MSLGPQSAGLLLGDWSALLYDNTGCPRLMTEGGLVASGVGTSSIGGAMKAAPSHFIGTTRSARRAEVMDDINQTEGVFFGFIGYFVAIGAIVNSREAFFDGTNRCKSLRMLGNRCEAPAKRGRFSVQKPTKNDQSRVENVQKPSRRGFDVCGQHAGTSAAGRVQTLSIELQDHPRGVGAERIGADGVGHHGDR